MGTLNYISYVIFAVIFISITLAIYTQYRQGSAEQEFMAKAELLAEQMEALGGQSTGTVSYFSINVPSKCQLSFSENAVLIGIGSWSDNFSAGIPIEGPVFTGGDLELRLERTDDGVVVSEQA